MYNLGMARGDSGRIVVDATSRQPALFAADSSEATYETETRRSAEEGT